MSKRIFPRFNVTRVAVLAAYIFFIVAALTLGVTLGRANGPVVSAEAVDELDNPPRLIGIGCKGASGPMWADEEDDFPAPCKSVKVIPLYLDDGQQPD